MATEQDFEQIPTTNVFTAASSTSEWYEHLEDEGSCLRLLHLLTKKRDLIHELGPKGKTVLHKGVRHGCVKLVKFILVNMFDAQGMCTCRRHGPDYSSLMREQLLRQTCKDGITAVNMAVVSGSPKMVLLLNWTIQFDANTENLKHQRKLSQKGANTYKDDRKLWTRSKWKKGCEVDGEDLQCLFEVVVNKEDISSTPTSQHFPNVVGEVKESVNVRERNLVVPNVKDDTIDQIYKTNSKESILIPKVYDLIKGILNKNWGPDQEKLDKLKDECQKHVDFEFVPLAHIFLHFLMYYHDWFLFRNLKFFERIAILKFLEEIVNEIFKVCMEWDQEGSMVVALFNILDPQGRTILHVSFETWTTDYLRKLMSGEQSNCISDFSGLPSSVIKECMNAKDGAGRTILHLICVSNLLLSTEILELLDWDVMLSPCCESQLQALQSWCSPSLLLTEFVKNFATPMHLALIFNSTKVLEEIHKTPKANKFYSSPQVVWCSTFIYEVAQTAAFLGRTITLEHFLKHFDGNFIQHLGPRTNNQDPQLNVSLPIIHCAALSGQVEAIQTILKYPVYDPIIQTRRYGTALHFLLEKKSFQEDLTFLQASAQSHALPNSHAFKRMKNDFFKLEINEDVPSMYSANEQSCINLLLQAGIDIWTPHCSTQERPNPGPMANDEARKWWYNKVVTEVVAQKTSISNAANATSVIAALVATASFIGPLQPPLSYTGDGGYIHTSLSPVRVYLICNSLSFFFSIASILMAVLPAIPMPKESLYDELFRSQRCLKAATLMLLLSIICLLIGFSSASIAVVSSEWRDRQLVVACIVVGGGICTAVLGIYIIRLLRMLFHKNDRFRRWFAKNMYF